MCICLLFSMMCLAVQASWIPENAASHQIEQYRHQAELYREKVIQSLLMGQHTKSGPHVFESVIHCILSSVFILAQTEPFGSCYPWKSI